MLVAGAHLPTLARAKCALIDQQGGHTGGLARLNAYPGIFKHQAVGWVGAEQFGHSQEGVGMGLVVGHVVARCGTADGFTVLAEGSCLRRSAKFMVMVIKV